MDTKAFSEYTGEMLNKTAFQWRLHYNIIRILQPVHQIYTMDHQQTSWKSPIDLTKICFLAYKNTWT